MSVRIFAFPTGRQGPRHEAALRATRIHSTKSEYGPGTRLHRGCRIGGRVSDGGRDGDDFLAIGLRGGLPETSRAYQDHRHHGEKQAIKRRNPRRVDEGGRRWGSAGSRAGFDGIQSSSRAGSFTVWAVCVGQVGTHKQLAMASGQPIGNDPVSDSGGVVAAMGSGSGWGWESKTLGGLGGW